MTTNNTTETGSHCAARLFTLNKNNGVITTACDQPIASGIACSKHAHINQLLEKVEEAGYPALNINPCYEVPGGRTAWMDTITVCPPPGQWFGLDAKKIQEIRQKTHQPPAIDRYTQIMTAIAQYMIILEKREAQNIETRYASGYQANEDKAKVLL